MSAPTTHDPLVVNTQDGVTWLRRAVVEGRGLYAVTDSCKCPEYLMASLAELAEHGIAGSADVLPMPVGPVPRSELDQVRDDVVDACLARWEAEQENERLFLAWGSARMRARRKNEALKKLRARVAELEARDAEAPIAVGLTELAVRSAEKLATLIAPSPTLRDPQPCQACGDLPEAWCPDCAACKAGCFGGFDGNSCSHANTSWGGVR